MRIPYMTNGKPQSLDPCCAGVCGNASCDLCYHDQGEVLEIEQSNPQVVVAEKVKEKELVLV